MPARAAYAAADAAVLPVEAQMTASAPSSAAGLAAIRRGAVHGERLAVTITGHGLKDTESADRYAPRLAKVAADPDAIAAAARGG